MSVRKHGDMFVAIVTVNHTLTGIFKHRDRMIAMRMASSFAWGSA